LILILPPASAETFYLHIYTYCEPGTNCGFADGQAHLEHVLAAVQELNLQYEGTGFSFRPIIYAIDSSNPDYYELPGCGTTSGSKQCADMATNCAEDSDCTGIGDGICHCYGQCFCENLSTGCTEDSHCSGIGDGICHALDRQRRVRWAKDVASLHPEGISLMLTEGANSCCSNPPSPNDPPWSLRSIYCDASRSVYDTGSVWAHEMGHYWCLRHTHTMQDMAHTTPFEPDHDGDGPLGITDTPDDPAPIEWSDRGGGLCDDGTSCTYPLECGPGNGTCDFQTVDDLREYCTPLVLYGFTSDGSPHGTTCISVCSRCYDGPCDVDGEHGNLTTIPYAPDMHLAISYHDHRCRGPFVIGGNRIEPFSTDQFNAIDTCYDDWPERSGLLPACAMLGGDSDHDGICDADDNCPVPSSPCFGDTKNTLQTDSDGDLIGDVCDLCPGDPWPTGDIDSDCAGDICDHDMDGDGCANWADQHPAEYEMVVGQYLHVGCSVSSSPMTLHEGSHSDGDWVPNCWDLDDDNDGHCDEGGPYAADPSRGIASGCVPYPELNADPCPVHANDLCTFPGELCLPEWAQVCFGVGCYDYFVMIDSVINPDPTRAMRFDKFEIYNQTLFFPALPGVTASESALAIQGNVAVKASDGGAEAADDLMTMEIWSRDPERRVAVVVEEYDASNVFLGDIDRGSFLAVIPTTTASSGQPRIDVLTRYSMGLGLDQALTDSDDDGRPDNVDNCLLAANFSQRDADGDGAGNACDADMNGDWMTTEADLESILSCVGADLTLTVPVSEPEDPAEDVDGATMELPDPIAYAFAQRCRAADLNDDSRVDATDVDLAGSLLGLPPGPGANHNTRPVAMAGPDQAAECDAVFVFADGSASYDPDGDPIGCRWTSSSCSFETPLSCSTAAICPHGVHQVDLRVDDGTAQSTDSTILFFPDCASPGRVENSLRLAKTGDTPPRLKLSWEPSCLPGYGDYGLYEGRIGDWTSHRQVTCTDHGADLEESIDLWDGDEFYLVVPHNGRAEGSYGPRSDGTERPVGLPGETCAPVQEVDDCSPF
jgi:hypothetical protein